MSIKVYNGYILRNCDLNRAFSLLKSIQQEAIKIAKNKMKIKVVKLDSPIPKVKSSFIIKRNIQKEKDII